MKNEYKIVKNSSDKYFIQIKVITTTGILWWKKTSEEWLDVDKEGEPYYYYNNGHPLGSFIGLKDAKAVIKMFKNKTI